MADHFLFVGGPAHGKKMLVERLPYQRVLEPRNNVGRFNGCIEHLYSLERWQDKAGERWYFYLHESLTLDAETMSAYLEARECATAV